MFAASAFGGGAKGADRGWHCLAAHKKPVTLRDLSQTSICSVILLLMKDHFDEHKEQLRQLGQFLKSSMPLEVRTALLKKVVSSQLVTTAQQVLSLISLHLSADVKHLSITGLKHGQRYIRLDQKECSLILEELEDNFQFSLETFELDGVSMERGFLSEIFKRSPRLQCIHVSGMHCSEVLDFLQFHPVPLSSLSLSNCTVTDEEVVNAIVGFGTDFQNLGRKDLETNNILHKSLISVTILSPFLTVCGALVLLRVLKNLRHLQYNSWNASETISFMKQVVPSTLEFALTSTDLFRPTEEDIISLRETCPNLKKMMIECCSKSLRSLQLLAEFPDLSSLTLRLVSEEHIFSAVNTLQDNLLELFIEFDEFTYHAISSRTWSAFQECCPKLQVFVIQNVDIDAVGENNIQSTTAMRYPELTHLTLSYGRTQPSVLRRLLQGNTALRSLTLDVNQDALTDTVLATLLKNNGFDCLASISLGAGMLSAKAIKSLTLLPALRNVSLDLKRFPLISESEFSSLEKVFVKSNYLCTLENTSQSGEK